MADAAAEMEEGGMVRTLKDLFAGAAGGIAQVLLGKSIIPACVICVLSQSFNLNACLYSASRVDNSGGCFNIELVF